MIKVKELKRLHEAGGVAFTQHQGWDNFDLPDDLVKHWKLFLKTQEEYKSILMKYEIIPDTTKEDNIRRAKWYVRQVLEALNCADQMNDPNLDTGDLEDEECAGVTTCFCLTMSFYNVERLTQECNEFTKDEVESLYNNYIQKYIDLVNEFYYDDYTKDFENALTVGVQWLRSTLDDILEMGESRDYPKGLWCGSDYWDEEMFEEYLDDYDENDYNVIADFIDTRMSELRSKIKEQRELDGI